MQQRKSLLSQWLMNSTLTYIFVEFLTRTFPEYSITKKCLNRMIAFIRESNVLVKNFDGKHQQSHVKSPAKSCNFTDRKGYEPPCFLGSSVRQNFDPTFVATLPGSSLSAGRFQKGKVQESSWKSGSIFTKFSGTPCIWAVMGNVKKKKKKKTRYRGIRVSCLTLRDVVLIRC